MEENKIQEMNVNVVNDTGFADPSPVLTLIFATLCFSFWANTMGLLGEGAVLGIGVLQLAVFVSYTIGGVILLRKGISFGGNTFMIFATVFGGVGGLTHVSMTIADAKGVAFCYQLCGIAFIAAGVFLLSMVPALLHKGTVCDVLMFLFGGLGLLGYGLTGAGIASAGLNYPSAWCLLVDGVVGFYTVIAGMNGFLGFEKMPLGGPVLKDRKH